MPYITTAERVGMKRGMARGMAQGIAALLEVKFGNVGEPLAARVAKIADAAILQELLEKLKRAQSLAEAQSMIAAVELKES